LADVGPIDLGIDRLITQLLTLREQLEREGERIRCKIVEYAFLSLSSMQSTTIFSEALTQLKDITDLSAHQN